ncbi:PAS domain-containing sensor histidine kinase [Saccharothrix luteola]|uniref:PAS domain-containing sensor histidine kinase n=1 Tax=Saccharothrix luteola TaxID=2893018 RepID=UPI001E372064|nr:PAS domain S-box protein [Saccharothrix luteola]MCC8250419.1 PAS domain S-box protein [Saccharothrix luteola]
MAAADHPAQPALEPPAEDAYRLLVDSVIDYAIFMLDPTGRVISWNAGAERIKGYSAEDIIGKHFSTFYPPEDLDARKPWYELEVAAEVGRFEDEGWRLRKDGSRFWANVIITALFEKSGRLRGFAKVTRDMTERMRAEEALRASEERFRLLVQGVIDYAIFMLDPTGRVISWNAGAERIKGYSAEEIVGEHFSTFYPPEDLVARKPWRELEVAAEVGRFEDEGWRLRKDGSRFWANVIITALTDAAGRLRGFAKVTRDMTEHRRVERTLTEQRRLVGHLVEAQELERRRIAWDVHDDSIQSMVAVGMRLQLLANRLPEQDAAVVRQLDEAVRASIGRLRNLVFRLRPPELDRHSLAQALDHYLTDLAGPRGMTYRLRHALDQEPPVESAITIFRICQEALVNVRKHARASAVEVSLTSVDGGTLVEVADNGIGVGAHVDTDAGVPADRPATDHFGMIEMRERAETAGGWWSVGRGPDGGTAVRFWIPDSPGGEP